MQRQPAAGDGNAEPELVAAERMAKALKEKLLARSPALQDEMQQQIWTHPSRDTSKFLALFVALLRTSDPFEIDDAFSIRCTCIRRSLCAKFSIAPKNPSAWQAICRDALGPALLQADTLQCYSQLLAKAAEQLRPAARAVQLAMHGMDAGMQRSQVAQAAPSTAARRRQQRQQQGLQGSLVQLELLLRESLALVLELSMGLLHLKDTCAETTTARTCGSPGATFPQLPPHPLHSLRGQVQSSWVLEHWAHVLLLGTAPALAGADGSRQRSALALHATLLPQLRRMCHFLDLDWPDVIRRPCGGVLALTHMAHLCAGVDGGDLFGRPRPAVIVLPQLRDLHPTKHAAAAEYDSAAVQRSLAVDLYPSGCTLHAWVALLVEALQVAPLRPAGEPQQPAEAAAAPAGRDSRCGSAEEEQEGGGLGAGWTGEQVGNSPGEGPQPGAAAAAAEAAAEERHTAGLATPDSLLPPPGLHDTNTIRIRIFNIYVFHTRPLLFIRVFVFARISYFCQGVAGGVTTLL